MLIMVNNLITDFLIQPSKKGHGINQINFTIADPSHGVFATGINKNFPYSDGDLAYMGALSLDDFYGGRYIDAKVHNSIQYLVEDTASYYFLGDEISYN